MNHYELMIIFSPHLTEEEEKQQVIQVEDLLKHENASIHLVDHWGKRKLANPVKKQRQGFYEWFYFGAEADHMTEVDRKLKMSESILRFMLLKMENVQVQNMQKEIARRKEVAAAAPVEPAASEPALQSEVAPISTEEPVETAGEPAEPSQEG